LLNLPEPIQDYVSRGTLSPGQVRPLLVLPTSELQVEAAEEIISGHMNAREAEDLSRRLQQRKLRPKSKKDKPAPAWLRETEEKLSRRLGTRVHVVAEDEGRGTLSIEFYSTEDLQRIIELIDEHSDAQSKNQSSAVKSISV
jgi:ParB family chromosome partitioning protein